LNSQRVEGAIGKGAGQRGQSRDENDSGDECFY